MFPSVPSPPSPPPPANSQSTPPSSPISRPPPDNSMFSARSFHQFTIFAAGSSFALLSALITRRAVARRKTWAAPPYFRKNNEHPPDKIHGPAEAMEAFTVATANVFSWAITLSGGALWAFNITGFEELRTRLRAKAGVVDGIPEDEADKAQAQVNEWVRGVVPVPGKAKGREGDRREGEASAGGAGQ